MLFIALMNFPNHKFTPFHRVNDLETIRILKDERERERERERE